MNVVAVEGIGPVNAQRLQEQGITTVGNLLEAAASKKGRQELAERSGLSEKLILEWVNRADLMRVPGIGEEYSDLLEHAGVDTVKELRRRNPANLHAAMKEVNDTKKLVRRMPGKTTVEKWVSAAGEMPPMVTY
jgi:predicted flap endonuclease-1-like 5' DNA nuclease